MRNTILGIIALGFFGACNSEPKEEVGRYVPIPQSNNSSIAILYTKTGLVYYAESRSSQTYFIQINPIKPQLKGAKIPFSTDLNGKGENYE